MSDFPSEAFAAGGLQDFAIFGIGLCCLAAVDMALFAPPSGVQAQMISLRMAMLQVIFWVCIGLLYNVYIFHQMGRATASEWLNAYSLEVLGVMDNLCLIHLVFIASAIPRGLMYKALSVAMLCAMLPRLGLHFLVMRFFSVAVWMQLPLGLVLIVGACGSCRLVRHEAEEKRQSSAGSLPRLGSFGGYDHNGALSIGSLVQSVKPDTQEHAEVVDDSVKTTPSAKVGSPGREVSVSTATPSSTFQSTATPPMTNESTAPPTPATQPSVVQEEAPAALRLSAGSESSVASTASTEPTAKAPDVWLQGTTMLWVVLTLVTLDTCFAIDSTVAIVYEQGGLYTNFTAACFIMLAVRPMYMIMSHLIKAYRWLEQGCVVSLVVKGVELILGTCYRFTPAMPLTFLVVTFGICLMLSVLSDQATTVTRGRASSRHGLKKASTSSMNLGSRACGGLRF